MPIDALVMSVLLAMPGGDGAADPWPFWGRTAGRVGNTPTVGPQSPRVEWAILFSDSPHKSLREGSPVMDVAGRIAVVHGQGITVVDSIARERLWTFNGGDNPRGAAIWGGRVVWGDVNPFSRLNCYDIATGEPIWIFDTPSGFNHSAPVVSPDGIVYIGRGLNDFYAIRIEDGRELWSRDSGGVIRNAPSLAWPTIVTSSWGGSGFDLGALDPSTGAVSWVFDTGRDVRGLSPIASGRAYVGSEDDYLYCVDLETGDEIWSLWLEEGCRGAVALGHDGTIYAGVHGVVGNLFAVSPDGEELWRFPLPDAMANPPIVGGDGTIYLCAHQWTGSSYLGDVFAIRPDGTLLWKKRMPDSVWASPMLAPDGTLYVVSRDNYMYGFRDNEVAGDATSDGLVGVDDLLAVLANWGPCPTLPEVCHADLDLNGEVGVSDLLSVLSSWE